MSNEDKRENTYRLLLLKEGLCTSHWLARALAQARVDPTKLCVGDTRCDHSIENRLPTVLLGPHPHHRPFVQILCNGVRCVRMQLQILFGVGLLLPRGMLAVVLGLARLGVLPRMGDLPRLHV